MLDLRVVGLLLAIFVVIASIFVTCAAYEFDEVAAGVRPLDAREFGALTLVTVGTGGAQENHTRRGPASVVGLGPDAVLVDAGRSISGALRHSEIPVRQPGTVLLTNLLPENTLGLHDLLVTGWMDGRREPVVLIGPEGTEELARALETAAARGVAAWSEALAVEGTPRFEVMEIGDGWSATLGGMQVSAAALPGGPTAALAYRFEARGRSAVLSGTGWGNEELTDFARGANLLLHQAVMVPTPEEAKELGVEVDPEQLRREGAIHTGFDEVGAIARRAGVGTLVLARLRPPPVYSLQVTTLIDDQFSGRIHVAEDGDEWQP